VRRLWLGLGRRLREPAPIDDPDPVLRALARGPTPIGTGTLDAPRLIALLGDDQPSRWLDRGWPRTIGDAALRALVELWGFDPRYLIGTPVGNPWSAQDRTEVAVKLQQWWRESGSQMDSLAIRCAALKNFGPVALGQVLLAALPEEQPHLALALLKHWPAGPPRGWPAGPFAKFLEEVEQAPGLAALVKEMARWPLTGATGDVLAAWMVRRGDATAVGRLLAGFEAGEAPYLNVAGLMGVCFDHGGPQHLPTLHRILDGPMGSEACRSLLLELIAPEQQLWHQFHAFVRRGADRYRADLRAACLRDVRLVDAALAAALRERGVQVQAGVTVAELMASRPYR
jgi:hypothetical protein